jgi:hypothetical protein
MQIERRRFGGAKRMQRGIMLRQDETSPNWDLFTVCHGHEVLDLDILHNFNPYCHLPRVGS